MRKVNGPTFITVNQSSGPVIVSSVNEFMFNAMRGLQAELPGKLIGFQAGDTYRIYGKQQKKPMVQINQENDTALITKLNVHRKIRNEKQIKKIKKILDDNGIEYREEMYGVGYLVPTRNHFQVYESSSSSSYSEPSYESSRNDRTENYGRSHSWDPMSGHEGCWCEDRSDW